MLSIGQPEASFRGLPVPKRPCPVVLFFTDLDQGCEVHVGIVNSFLSSVPRNISHTKKSGASK